MLAQFIHPYLHMRYRDLIDRGPLVVRVLAKTAYFRYLARHHWLHTDTPTATIICSLGAITSWACGERRTMKTWMRYALSGFGEVRREDRQGVGGGVSAILCAGPV